MGDLLCGEGNGLNFTINGNVHPWYYLFANEIYLQWNDFVQIIEVFTLCKNARVL
jgi:hypothetical protein